jgi:hypothetical protein
VLLLVLLVLLLLLLLLLLLAGACRPGWCSDEPAAALPRPYARYLWQRVRASFHPVILLLDMPAAQHIASADYAAAVMLPLRKANVYYTELLLKHAAAQALEVEEVFELLDCALQQRAMRKEPRSWGDGEVWVGGCELLLGLPAAQELDEAQVEVLLGHVMVSQSDR